MTRILAALLALGLGACGRNPSSDEGRPAPAPSPSIASPPPRANAPPPRPAATGEGWNAAQIDWKPYEAGMALGKTQGKPICLVFWTTWCPHCRNYSHVFEDPKIVERARDFVMIRVNPDENAQIGQQYQIDGGY